MKLYELFQLDEKIDIEDMRLRAIEAMSKTFADVYKNIQSGGPQPETEEFKEYLLKQTRTSIQNLFSNYLALHHPMKMPSDQRTDTMSTLDYYFFVYKMSEMPKDSKDRVTQGSFMPLKHKGEWVIVIKLSLPDIVFEKQYWETYPMNPKRVFKIGTEGFIKTLMHEITHYIQAQRKGDKWADDDLYVKSYNKSFGSGLGEDEYSLRPSEIQAFAANVALSLIDAIEENKLSDVNQIKSLLTSKSGIQELSQYSSHLEQYYSLYRRYFSPRVHAKWKNRVKKSQLASKVWRLLVKQIIIHLNNYEPNQPVKTQPKLKVDKPEIQKAETFLQKIGKLFQKMIGNSSDQ